MAACGQHLWYNDPGVGDIMSLDVRVVQTAETTYFETLGWNEGGEGGVDRKDRERVHVEDRVPVLVAPVGAGVGEEVVVAQV